ncbi:MAG: hypothetical protein JRH14_18490 [Deltaproteobacteria bacterium]|nr:hypothetical protein [Deltaproteobacteria bacterium]
MRYLFGVLCVCALGVMPTVGCSEGGGGGGSGGSDTSGWFLQRPPTEVGDSFNGVSFTDANSGTAVGYGLLGGGDLRGIILRTTDGGATWVEQTSGTSEPLHDVSFTDANTGTIVGEAGIILRTTDGGGV